MKERVKKQYKLTIKDKTRKPEYSNIQFGYLEYEYDIFKHAVQMYNNFLDCWSFREIDPQNYLNSWNINKMKKVKQEYFHFIKRRNILNKTKKIFLGLPNRSLLYNDGYYTIRHPKICKRGILNRRG